MEIFFVTDFQEDRCTSIDKESHFL